MYSMQIWRNMCARAIMDYFMQYDWMKFSYMYFSWCACYRVIIALNLLLVNNLPPHFVPHFSPFDFSAPYGFRVFFSLMTFDENICTLFVCKCYRNWFAAAIQCYLFAYESFVSYYETKTVFFSSFKFCNESWVFGALNERHNGLIEMDIQSPVKENEHVNNYLLENTFKFQFVLNYIYLIRHFV